MSAPDPEAAKATIQAYVDRFSAKDKEGWLDLFTDDGTFEDPVGSPVRTGKAEIGEFFDQSHGMVDEVKLVIDRPVTVCGDEAVMVFHIEALTGGATMRIEAVDVFRLSPDAKIASQRAFWDPAAAQIT